MPHLQFFWLSIVDSFKWIPTVEAPFSRQSSASRTPFQWFKLSRESFRPLYSCFYRYNILWFIMDLYRLQLTIDDGPEMHIQLILSSRRFRD